MPVPSGEDAADTAGAPPVSTASVLPRLTIVPPLKLLELRMTTVPVLLVGALTVEN